MLSRITFFILIGFLSIGCQGDKPEPLPDRVEINSSADIVKYCDQFSNLDSYSGALIINTEEELDLSCFINLKVIEGTLLLSGPNVTLAFQNIEHVGGEGLVFCDTKAKEVSFPKLTSVTTLGLFSLCPYIERLHVPNVETISRLQLGSFSSLGNVEGLHKVKSIDVISIDVDSISSLDIFNEVETVNGIIDLKLESYTEFGRQSFNKLENIVNNLTLFSEDPNLQFETIFPDLKQCADLRIINSNAKEEDFCYLIDQLLNDDIVANITTDFGRLNNQIIIDACN